MAVSRESKVGAFVLAGMVAAGLVIFLIGDERRLFDGKQVFRASFSDVQGLKPGSPVRMGGIDIGSVGRVAHAEEPTDPRLYVELYVARAETARVRADSVARIANKGLLGDKMIEITAGSQARAAIAPGAVIPSEDPADFSNLTAKVGGMASHAEQILENLDATTKVLAGDKFREDLQASVGAIRIILHDVAEGDGYAHRLLTDKGEADRVSRIVSSLERTSDEAHATLAETHRLVAQMNSGPGLVHDLAYGETGQKTVARLGEVAGELATTLRAVREGSGLARALLFGDGDARAQGIISNVDATTADIRHIVADVRAGKGTIGGLLVDPSIYDDMKTVLGNVQRNDALRALVRYSIKQDEKRAPPKVDDPGPR